MQIMAHPTLAGEMKQRLSHILTREERTQQLSSTGESATGPLKRRSGGSIANPGHSYPGSNTPPHPERISKDVGSAVFRGSRQAY